MMWRVELNPESRNYLVDSGLHVTELLRELRRLELSDNGRPAAGMVDDMEAGVFVWGVAGHLLLFRRVEDSKVIRVLLIKPVS